MVIFKQAHSIPLESNGVHIQMQSSGPELMRGGSNKGTAVVCISTAGDQLWTLVSETLSSKKRRKRDSVLLFQKWEMLLFITVWYKVWRGGVVALRVPSWWLEDGGGGWCPARRLGIWKTAEELDLTQMWKYFSIQTAIELSSRLVSKARAYWATKGRIQWVHIYSNV